MTGNGKQLKLMVLQGPLTNEQLRSSHSLSRLVINGGKFTEIQAADEVASLAGRNRVGSPIQYVFPYSNNQGNHHLEFKARESLEFPVLNASLVLVSYFEDSLKKVITVQYYSGNAEETIEYFI